jgi:hypothetical protein
MNVCADQNYFKRSGKVLKHTIPTISFQLDNYQSKFARNYLMRLKTWKCMFQIPKYNKTWKCVFQIPKYNWIAEKIEKILARLV